MTKETTKVVVLGGGPAGYAAAFMAADLGLEVTLVELDTNPGGTCLYRGCIPSKALLHVAKVIHEAEEASHFGLNFEYGAVNYSNFAFSGTGKPLSKRAHSFHSTIEWIPINRGFGTFSIGLGFGVYQSGQVVTIPQDPTTEAEKQLGDTVDRSNVLTTYPIEVFVGYRAQFTQNQIVVPTG